LFGHSREGEARLYTLEGRLLRARFTDYAGALVSLEAPDRDGRWDHVVLGFSDVTAYVDNRGSFGALLGRNANRIAGGRIVVDANTFELSKNEGGNTLHGGAVGFGKRLWSLKAASADQLTFGLTSTDADQGFPSQVSVATWRLGDGELSLTFRAETTKATPLSFSAHPYFNLDGSGASGHRIVSSTRSKSTRISFFRPTNSKFRRERFDRSSERPSISETDGESGRLSA
jgi:aldose 1-epimerase